MNTPDSLPRRMRRIIAETLEPGEETLWLARASPRLFTVRTFAPFGLGVMVLLFMGYAAWERSRNPSPANDPDSPIMFALFCLVGAGLASVPLLAWLIGRRTVYAVTDRRALIIEDWPTKRIRSFGPGELRWNRRDNFLGRSDIVFGSEVTSYEVNGDNTRDYGFLNIKDAGTVERLLRDLIGPDAAGQAQPSADQQPAVGVLDAIPERLAQRLNAELKTGEQVVWRATPAARWFSSESTSAFLFGLILIVFVSACAHHLLIGQSVTVASDPMLIVAGMFGTVFLGLALLLLFTPLGERLRSRTTLYAITDRRLITIAGRSERTICSYRPEQLIELTRIDQPDHRGDILIGDRKEIEATIQEGNPPRGLYNIHDPARVERLIRNLVRQYHKDALHPAASRPSAKRPINRPMKRYN